MTTSLILRTKSRHLTGVTTLWSIVRIVPVVLYSANGMSKSGYSYDDRTGVSYQYPLRYRQLIRPGVPFVYHFSGLGYVGSGIIGEVAESGVRGQLVCKILDYSPFEKPVPLRSVDGFYYEADPAEGKTGGVYWSQGVREVSIRAFELIVGYGVVLAGDTPDQANDRPKRGRVYAPSDVARAVERYSVDVAMDLLSIKFPGEQIREMAHSNPGFDILVGPLKSPVAFVEVKGTQSSEPVFWMSEGERKFSEANSVVYLLIVVTAIDLVGVGEHYVHIHKGRVDDEAFDLNPSQWRGQLRA